MFENMKILILGMARSGYESAKVLVKRNNDITITDMKEESALDKDKINELRKLGIKFVLGSHPDDLLDESYDYLIKNPGVPINHKYVMKANDLKVKVINEVELAYKLFPSNVNLIGITGTNGKTTTTTLIYDIIKKSGVRVHLTGNIGYPLCSFLDDLQSGDIVVMEVSCQQLENVDEFKPHIAVMTNLTPAHIDFFGSYEKYKEVKTKIFKNQTKDDIAILNIENNDVIEVTKNIISSSRYFSSKNEINGCYLKNNKIYYHNESVLDLDKIILKGNHNYENIMASILVAKELGISNDIIQDVIYNFKGVEHRLEYVKTLAGRQFYNDSKATNNEALKTALKSFATPVILLMGGLDRGQDFTELTPYFNYVKLIVCYGQNKLKIVDYAKSINKEVIMTEDLATATKIAYEKSLPNDIILLSPGTASWDQYKCFEDRGLEYKTIVEGLENED